MNDHPHPFQRWLPHHRGHDHDPPPPTRRPPPHHGYEIATLRELLGARSAAPVDLPTLIRHADVLDPSGWVGNFLRENCEGLGVHLALDFAGITQRVALERELVAAIERMRDREVVAIPPLPPHIFDRVAGLGHAVLFETGHPIPRHERHTGSASWTSDPFVQRERMESADFVLFDAVIVGGVPYVRRAIAQLLDPRLLRSEASLLVHYRPRGDDGDMPLHSALVERLSRI